MDRDLPGLAGLLDDLDNSISDLDGLLKSDDLELARRPVESMISAVRAVNDLLPTERKRPKGAFRQVQKHARFVELYLDRGDLAYVRSNTAALGRDMVRLRAELAPALGAAVMDLAIIVEELPAGPAKLSLREAISNYRAGTYGSSIVSAVNALDGFLRDLRRERLGVDNHKGRLVDVIEDLERGKVLTSTESPLAQIVRLYRNYSAHPSGFAPTAADARMVIQFVFAKLRSK